MSVLVVGLSYRTAPLALLERAALTAAAAPRAGGAARAAATTSPRPSCWPPATGSRSTPRSASSTAASPTSARRWPPPPGVALAELTDHLYVHYEAAAVATCSPWPAAWTRWPSASSRSSARSGSALRAAPRRPASVGRVARRTCCSRRCGSASGPTARPGSTGPGTPWSRPGSSAAEAGASARSARRHVLVVGAGAMSGLAVATLQRPAPAGSPSPTARRSGAERLAAAVGGRTVVRWPTCPAALAAADVVVSCTGAVGHVVDADLAGRRRRGPRAAGPRSTSTSPCRATSSRARRGVAGRQRRRPGAARPPPGRPTASAPRLAQRAGAGRRRRSPDYLRRSGPRPSPRPSSRCARWPAGRRGRAGPAGSAAR